MSINTFIINFWRACIGIIHAIPISKKLCKLSLKYNHTLFFLFIYKIYLMFGIVYYIYITYSEKKNHVNS